MKKTPASGSASTLRCALVVAVIFAGLSFFISSAGATPPPGYYLVWQDEFNSRSLDDTKWEYWLLGPRRDAVNVTNAVSLDGSNLVITTYTSNHVHYTGMVATRNNSAPGSAIGNRVFDGATPTECGRPSGCNRRR